MTKALNLLFICPLVYAYSTYSVLISDLIYIPLLSAFLISIMTLSPTFSCISSYSLILNLMVGESPDDIPPAPDPPNMFDIALGKFFIKSSGDVKVPTPTPNGL